MIQSQIAKNILKGDVVILLFLFRPPIFILQKPGLSTPMAESKWSFCAMNSIWDCISAEKLKALKTWFWCLEEIGHFAARHKKKFSNGGIFLRM